MRVVVNMDREKETKNTVRYAEAGEHPQVGMIYLPKATLEGLGAPTRITLTVDAAQAA